MSPTILQQQFLAGKPPKKLAGFYRGELLLVLPRTFPEHIASSVSSFFVPWKGKYFSEGKQVGDNILPLYTKFFLRLYQKDIFIGHSGFGGFHAFPFTTSLEKGILDDIDVLRLTYDLPENPPRVKSIVDELVEVEEDTYLGKAHLKETDIVRTVAFFLLKHNK